MTYTQQVREYCETHKGTLIDISKVKDEEFADIHYKTLLKILNRLEEEDIVHTVSKGVYSIGKLKSGNQPNVLKRYTSDGRGMVVGYMLYHSMGIVKVILSNFLPLSGNAVMLGFQNAVLLFVFLLLCIAMIKVK